MNFIFRWVSPLAALGLAITPVARASASDSLAPAAKDAPRKLETIEAPGGPTRVSTQILLGTTSIMFDGLVFRNVVTNVVPGTRVTIGVSAGATSLKSVTWRKNSTKLDATGPILDLGNVTAASSGFYSADIVTDPASSLYVAQGAMIRVEPAVTQRLLNLSTRVRINAAQPVVIAGFVVSPQAAGIRETKYLLIRAVGPTLANYGVTDPLPDPVIEIYHADGTKVPDPITVAVFPGPLDWATARVGAFPLLAGGKDKAAVYSLPQGVYSARISSASGGTGSALLEIYDVPDDFANSLAPLQ